jgi:DNA-binding MarR family transcriptional regulator
MRLHELDDLVSRVRTVIQRPGYRRRVLTGIDVPGGISTLRTLRVVANFSVDGKPSIKEVATRLGVEHSTASRSIDTAVRAGLLHKSACDRDQRRIRVGLTPSGDEVLAETSERRRALLGDIVADWPDGDVDDLVRLLTELCRGFDHVEEQSR